MKKIFLLLLVTIIVRENFAQVLINLQLPPSGITLKSQLWNFSLVNTSSDILSVQVEITITDLSNNQHVLTASSNRMQLAKGIKLVHVNDAAPVTYNVSNTGYSIDASPEGFLPVGKFAVCYTVLQIIHNGVEQVADDCANIEVEPLSPPILIMPADSEVVTVVRPVFNWMPPSPYNLFNSLQYSWVLTEVLPMQTGAVAVQQNIPLASQSGLSVPVFAYPASLQALDENKLYAWQVTAKNNTTAIAQSEVWTFRIKKADSNDLIKKDPEGFFAKLKHEEDAATVLCYGVLRFEYLNEINNGMVRIDVSDISVGKRKTISLDQTEYPVTTGRNFMQMDLRDKNLATGHTYLLQLNSASGEHWYLKFEYRKRR